MPSGALRNLDDLIETINRGIIDVKNMSSEQRRDWMKEYQLVPPNIPLGSGSFIFTTAEGLAALHEFGRRWRNENPQRQRILGEDKAAELAVLTYGELLKRENENYYRGDTNLKVAFKELLLERLAAMQVALAHYLPCQIFDQPNLPSFEVGPVRFVPRDLWLENVQRKAGKPLAWVNEVRDHWAGRSEVGKPTPQSLELGDSTTDGNPWAAWEVVDAVGSCIWIAIIEIPGREYLQSRSCAEAVVRLAIDTLGLPLAPVMARRIRHTADETRPRLRRSLMQAEGGGLSSGSHLDLPSLRGAPGRDEALLDHTANLRAWAGAAIQSLVETKPSSPISNLHQRWLDALYWFGQSRREPTEFVGLVNVGICLDVLAKGQKARGIIALCCALFGMQPDTIVLAADGTSLRGLVATIYNEGRSQIGHGGRPSLLKELPIRVDTAIIFAAHVLARYIEGLSRYDGPDRYESYLSALPSVFTLPAS